MMNRKMTLEAFGLVKALMPAIYSEENLDRCLSAFENDFAEHIPDYREQLLDAVKTVPEAEAALKKRYAFS